MTAQSRGNAKRLGTGMYRHCGRRRACPGRARAQMEGGEWQFLRPANFSACLVVSEMVGVPRWVESWPAAEGDVPIPQTQRGDVGIGGRVSHS